MMFNSDVALTIIALAAISMPLALLRLVQGLDETNRLLNEIADLLCDDDDGGEPEDVPEPTEEKTNVIPIVRRTA